MMFRDKRGGERYLSPWMFVVWALILVGIVAGVIIFYAAQIDVRADEADILSTRIADCLIENGKIMENLGSFDIFETCNFNEEIIENEELFFIDIRFFVDGKEKEELRKRYGVLGWESLCAFQEEDEQENFPRCSEKTVYGFTDKEFKIKILTASNQIGKESI